MSAVRGRFCPDCGARLKSGTSRGGITRTYCPDCEDGGRL